MNYSKSSNNENYILSLAKGIAFSYILTFVLIILLAVVMTYTSLSESVIPVINSIIMILSISVGAIYMSLKISSKGWLNGSVIGIVYIILAILISSIFGSIVFNVYLVMKVLVALVTGAVGGMIGVNLK